MTSDMYIVQKDIFHGGLNLHKIAESGQCFRIEEVKPLVGLRYYNILSSDKFARVIDTAEGDYLFDCSDSDFNFWKTYFDIETDYDEFHKIISQSDDSFLKSASDFGRGMRILNQNYWEMLVSFIISQNNSIPRIKKSISDFCARFGNKLVYEDQTFYTFPTRDSLSGISIEDLQGLGLGYRDQYILDVCTCDWANLKADRDTLLRVRGIGPKVASCILLYGAHHLEEYPVDTWMRRIIDEVYGGDFDGSAYKSFLGYVQLLEFYYYRHLNGKAK